MKNAEPAAPTSAAAVATDAPPSDLLVSVVMPCLNEELAVGECVRVALRALADMGVDGEVVVVDNASTDRSASRAREAGARVVHEDRRGYGSAYLRGLEEARGDYVVMGDADGSYDFRQVRRFVKALEEGNDFVIGSRFAGDILPGAMPWSHRYIGNPILSGLLRVFFHTRVGDSHCGLRAVRRSALPAMDLHTTGMEFASEMVVKAVRGKLRIAEIPITYHPRLGASKLSSLRDAWRHTRFMLLFSPSYLFQIPGLLLVAAGLALLAALAGGPREIFGHVWDFHVLMFGALMLILGYNLVLLDVAAKAFSMATGLARPGHWLRRLATWFSLEKGLLAGLAMVVLGLGLEAKVVFDWIESGRGPLMAVREVTIGLTVMALGAQTVFGSFLTSLALIQHR